MCLSADEIDAEVLVGSLVGLDNFEEDVLLIETRVLSQGAGNDQKGV